MTILTILKRTTALAAIAALPLAPAAVQAESAQVTGTQPPSAEAQQTQAQPEKGDKKTGVDKAAAAQAIDKEADSANEAGTVTDGQEGTQSGEAPDQAQTGAQAGQATDEEKGPANEAGIVTEGQEGTQSGEAPDQAPTGDQTGLGNTPAQDQANQTDQQGAAAGEQSMAGEDDALVATVGDREIRRSDVLSVIGMLPAQLQQQSPEMLIPIALDQLVMRELILQEAKGAGLEDDPALTSLAEGATERAREDAMVEVWLEKELGDAVTEEKVQETYDTVKQQMGAQAPDVETLRPQIEQELRQQAFLDLSRDLQEDAEITLYGPDGQPVTQ